MDLSSYTRLMKEQCTSKLWSSYLVRTCRHWCELVQRVLKITNVPTYQTPPGLPVRSKTVTLMPAFFRCAAVTTPLIPAPMMAT